MSDISIFENDDQKQEFLRTHATVDGDTLILSAETSREFFNRSGIPTAVQKQVRAVTKDLGTQFTSLFSTHVEDRIKSKQTEGIDTVNTCHHISGELQTDLGSVSLETRTFVPAKPGQMSFGKPVQDLYGSTKIVTTYVTGVTKASVMKSVGREYVEKLCKAAAQAN